MTDVTVIAQICSTAWATLISRHSCSSLRDLWTWLKENTCQSRLGRAGARRKEYQAGGVILRAGRSPQIKEKSHSLLQEIRLSGALHMLISLRWQIVIGSSTSLFLPQFLKGAMPAACCSLILFSSNSSLSRRASSFSEMRCSKVTLLSWLMLHNNHSTPLQCTLLLRGRSFLTPQITPWHPFLAAKPGKIGMSWVSICTLWTCVCSCPLTLAFAPPKP